MRISDWSSDVCSSDLIDTEVERLQWAAVVGGISLVLSLLIAWRLGYLIRRPLLDISAAANRLRNLDFDTPPLGRPRLRQQLGRASCRERVGQYGEISVVAGLLNKKKYNTIETR